MNFKKLTTISCRKFLTIILMFTLFSCKKSSSNDCGLSGGVVSSNTYLFWTSQDFGCGPITVTLKDEQGNKINAYHDMISYISATAPECNNVNYGKYATFDIYPGKKYTYFASCSGKSWSGSITVPCEQNKCENVQLK